MKDLNLIKSQLFINEDEATIDIFDAIGAGDFFEPGIDAKSVNEDIRDIPSNVSTLNVRINSPGGSVFEGMSIHDQLKRFKGKVVVDIVGTAASIAAVIAMAGDEISISENGMFMIHKPYGMAFGESSEMRHTANLLDKLEDDIVNTLALRSGQRRSEVKAMLKEETWLSSKEAVDLGFADRVVSGRKIAACAKFGQFKNQYKNMPKFDEFDKFASDKRKLQLLEICD